MERVINRMTDSCGGEAGSPCCKHRQRRSRRQKGTMQLSQPRYVRKDELLQQQAAQQHENETHMHTLFPLSTRTAVRMRSERKKSQKEMGNKPLPD